MAEKVTILNKKTGKKIRVDADKAASILTNRDLNPRYHSNLELVDDVPVPAEVKDLAGKKSKQSESSPAEDKNEKPTEQK